MSISSIKLIIGVLVLSFGFQASAYSQCDYLVSQAYSGDGSYWMVTPGGGASFSVTLPSANHMIATVMLAQSLGKTVGIRFAADGVNCADFGTRGDVIGIWQRN